MRTLNALPMCNPLLLAAVFAAAALATGCGSSESGTNNDTSVLDADNDASLDTSVDAADDATDDATDDAGRDTVDDVAVDTGPVCAANSDCAGGEICSDGTCRAVCSADGDCSGDIPFCDDDSRVCVECLTDENCDGACIGGSCELVGGCASNADCAGGELCNVPTGECYVIECQSDDDCAIDEICDRQRFDCVPSNPGCESDSDCEGGEVCDEGSCIPIGSECVNGRTECADDQTVQVCSGGQWTNVSCEGGACIDGECEGGIICSPGDRYCDESGNAVRCNPDGTDTISVECLDDQTCFEGSCENAGNNGCGGDADLPDLGETCGDCEGTYVCDGPNDLQCDDPGANACGTCGVLDGEPGDTCGEGCAIWRCDTDGDVACVAEGENECGGCGDLPGAEGEACGEGECGVYECTADGGMVCEGGEGNGCGGCDPLMGGTPGDSCGTCGTWVCAQWWDNVTCEEQRANDCGGCAELSDAPGDDCSTPDGTGGIYICNGDNAVECESFDPSDCTTDTECEEIAALIGANPDNVACDPEVGCFTAGACEDNDPLQSSCRAGTTCGDQFGFFNGCTACVDETDCRIGETCQNVGGTSICNGGGWGG